MTDFQPIDVAVVGGGISGLACAFWAKERGLSLSLYEASPEVGGSIQSLRTDQYVADGGPQSFLVSGSFSKLIKDARLDDLMMPAAPGAARPYLFHGGKLTEVPQSPPQALRSSLLSLSAKVRLLNEPFIAASDADDESVAAFVRRRAGDEVLHSVVAPFVSGTFAGDASKLSMRSAFPAVAELERQHGSVLRGAFAKMKASRKNGSSPRRPSVGFRGGNDALPKVVAHRLGTDCRVNSPVKALWQRGQWWEILIGGSPEQRVVAKSVVLATPAPVTAELLAPLDAQLAKQLRGVEYPTVVQIAMAYPRDGIGVPLDGFGFLASRHERLKILGCVWNSVMFPDRCPKEEVLVTAFMGGATDRSVASQSDDELARLAHQDLTRVMKIKDTLPHIVAGFRWQEAIPQYNVGHANRMRIVDEGMARLPRVHLCGNYLRGPSVADCIKLAQDVSDKL